MAARKTYAQLVAEFGDEVLTPEEVAKELRVHPRTVERAFRSGQIPAVKVGRQWRCLRSALERHFRGPRTA